MTEQAKEAMEKAKREALTKYYNFNINQIGKIVFADAFESGYAQAEANLLREVRDRLQKAMSDGQLIIDLRMYIDELNERIEGGENGR